MQHTDTNAAATQSQHPVSLGKAWFAFLKGEKAPQSPPHQQQNQHSENSENPGNQLQQNKAQDGCRLAS